MAAQGRGSVKVLVRPSRICVTPIGHFQQITDATDLARHRRFSDGTDLCFCAPRCGAMSCTRPGEIVEVAGRSIGSARPAVMSPHLGSPT